MTESTLTLKVLRKHGPNSIFRKRAELKYKNSLSIFAFQILTIASQLVYGAISSRLVSALDFGLYASSLAIIAIVNLVFSSAFTEDVIRNSRLEGFGLRRLVSKALIFGSTSFAVVFAAGVLLHIFSGLSLLSLFVAGLIAMVSPLQNILVGIYSRDNLFFSSSLLGFVSSVLGFLTAGVLVIFSPTATSLLVSPLIASLGFVLVGGSKFRKHLFPLEIPRKVEFSLSGFSSKLFIYRAVWFLNSNLSRWVLILAGAQKELGHLNRAEVLSSVPIFQLQSSINKPFYPKYADISLKSGESKSESLNFTKSIGAVTILLWPSLIISSMIVQQLTLILFGPNWVLAASITPILFIAGGLQIPVVLMSTAVETNLLFRKTYLAESVILGLQIAFFILAWGKLDLLSVAIEMALVMSLRFVFYLWILSGQQLLGIYPIARSMILALVICALVAASLFFSKLLLVSLCNFDDSLSTLLAGALVAVAWLFFILFTRKGKITTTRFVWLIS